MPQQNVQVVVRHVDACNRRDLDAVLAGITEDYVLDWSRSGGPASGVHRGRDGLEGFLRSSWDAFDPLLMKIEPVAAAGDHVVADFTLQGRSRTTGLDMTGPPAAQVWTLREGLVAGATMYPTRAEALEAVGLQG